MPAPSVATSSARTSAPRPATYFSTRAASAAPSAAGTSRAPSPTRKASLTTVENHTAPLVTNGLSLRGVLGAETPVWATRAATGTSGSRTRPSRPCTSTGTRGASGATIAVDPSKGSSRNAWGDPSAPRARGDDSTRRKNLGGDVIRVIHGARDAIEYHHTYHMPACVHILFLRVN